MNDRLHLNIRVLLTNLCIEFGLNKSGIHMTRISNMTCGSIILECCILCSLNFIIISFTLALFRPNIQFQKGIYLHKSLCIIFTFVLNLSYAKIIQVTNVINIKHKIRINEF